MAHTQHEFKEVKIDAPKTKWVKIPYYPRVVKLSDLKANGKVFDDHTINLIEEKLKDLPDPTRLAKEDLTKKYGIPNERNYGIIKAAGKFYAIIPEPLGKGSFGITYAGQELRSGKFIAVKTQAVKTGLEREYKILGLLKRSEAVFFVRDRGNDKPKREHAPQKLMKGISLFDYIYKQSITVSPVELLNIALKVIVAVKEFHKKTGMLHGDIHIQNILIDPFTNKIKLIDFGLVMKKGEPGAMPTLNHWYPPEYNDRDKKHEPVDVYQLGYLFKFILGYTHDQDGKDIQYSTALSDNALYQEFLDRMMAKEPNVRPTLTEVTQFIKHAAETALQKYPKHICIVNLEEYKSYSPEIRKKFIDELKKYHEVIFANSMSFSHIDFKNDTILLDLFEQCRTQHIKFKDSVFIQPTFMDLREYFSAEQQKENILIHATILSIPFSGKVQETEVFSGNLSLIKRISIAIQHDLHDELRKILRLLESDIGMELFDPQLKLNAQKGLRLIKHVLEELEKPNISLITVSNSVENLMTGLKKLAIYDDKVVIFINHCKEILQLKSALEKSERQIEKFQSIMEHLLSQIEKYEDVSDLTKQAVQKMRAINDDFNSLVDYYQNDKTAHVATLQMQLLFLDDKLINLICSAVNQIQAQPLFREANEFVRHIKSVLPGSGFRMQLEKTKESAPVSQQNLDSLEINFERQVIFLQKRLLNAVNEVEKLKDRPVAFIENCHKIANLLNQWINKYNGPGYPLDILKSEFNVINEKFNKLIDREKKPLRTSITSLNLPFFMESGEFLQVLRDASSHSDKSKTILHDIQKQFKFTLKPLLLPDTRLKVPEQRTHVRKVVR